MAVWTDDGVRIVPPVGDRPTVPSPGQRAAPGALAAALAGLRADVVAATGSELTRAVVTVPADASYASRRSLTRTAAGVGIEVLRLIERPVAAGMAVASADDLRELDVDLLVVHVGADAVGAGSMTCYDGVIDVAGLAGQDLAASSPTDVVDATVAVARRALDGTSVDPDRCRPVVVGDPHLVGAVAAAVGATVGGAPMEVDPGAVTALGAAVQAAVLTGRRGDVLLLPLLPWGIGLELSGRLVAAVAPRTTYPTRTTTPVEVSDASAPLILREIRPGGDHGGVGGAIASLDLTPVAARPGDVVDVAVSVDANPVLHVELTNRTRGRHHQTLITDPPVDATGPGPESGSGPEPWWT